MRDSLKNLCLSGVVLSVFLGLAGSWAATIDSIRAVTRSGEPFSDELVMANVRSLPGTILDRAVLSADIEQLYKTGLLSDVSAAVEALGEDRVRVVFTVVPVPRVAEVIFEGNSLLSDRKLKRKIETKTGDLLDHKQVAMDGLAIRDAYESKGYHGTKVSSYERPVAGDDGQVAVVWKVEEAPRHKIRRVDFVGNSAFSERKLRKAMLTRHSWWSFLFPAGFYQEQKLDADKDGLGTLYASEGYLDFRITDIVKEYSSNEKWLSLTIHVEEGQPYSVGETKVSGNQLFGADELVPLLRVVGGTTYRPADEVASIQEIQGKYWPLGYIDLACRARMEKVPGTHVVNLDFQISEGTPATIRDIYISGNMVTRDEVVRRELRVLPGDLADPGKLDVSRKVLQNLGYFEEVVVVPRSTDVEGEKDVDIDVTEKRTGQLLVGAGFSSEDALVGTVEVSQSNFDWRNWPRLTGDGQRLRLRLEFGTERTDFSVSFIEPWWLDRRLRLEMNVFSSSRDQDQYTEESIGADFLITRQLRKFWRQSFGYRLQQTKLTDFDDDVDADLVLVDISPELLAEEGTYVVSRFLYQMARDSRDRFVHPTRGSRLELRGELQTEALGGYNDMYRLSAQASKYIPLVENTVLRMHGEVAVAEELSGDPPAIFDRYFAGGSSSFRGFDRREVSPVDINEDPVGGQTMFLGSFEIFYRWTDMIRTSVFSDFGNVWRDAYDWDGDINVSVGVGLQLDLPVGPIRLEYGIPVVTQEDHLDGGGRLHFNMGVLLVGQTARAASTMKILNLYIGKSLLMVTGMAIGILTFVMVSANLLEAFELVAKGIPAGLIGRFMLYMMPFALQFTIPLAMLCAAVLVFSRLSADQEINAMRASGVSLWQIISPGLILAAILSGVCLYLQAKLAPDCRYQAYLLQRFGTVENPVGLLEAGRYVEFRNHIVYVGDKSGHDVRDIQVYSLDNRGRVTEDISAGAGTVEFDQVSGALVLRLRDFTGRKIDRDASGAEKVMPIVSREMTYRFEMANEDRHRRVTRRTKHMDVRSILGTIYLNTKWGEPTGYLYLELHKRMSMAFSPIGFLLMGIPFGIRTRRSEASVGLVSALVLATVFYVFLSLADSLSEQPQLHPEILVWLPNVIYQVGGLIALHRITKR